MRHPHKQKSTKSSRRSKYVLTLEERIDISLQLYPSLFKDRYSVLEHLFLVTGNGYEWENGELVDGLVVTSVSDKKRLIQEHYENDVNRHIRLTGMDEESANELRKSIKTKKGIADYIEQNRKNRAKREEFYKKNVSSEIFPFCLKYLSRYADILSIPPDVKPEYLQAAKELIEYVEKHNPKIIHPELWEQAKQLVYSFPVATSTE